MKIPWKLMRITVTHNVNTKKKKEKKSDWLVQRQAVKKSFLTKQILYPISLFPGYEASDYIQTEKIGCHASTDNLKNCFKNFSVTYILYNPDLSLHKK